MSSGDNRSDGNVSSSGSSHQIRCLGFLLMKLHGNSEAISALQEENLGAALETELTTYLTSQRPLVSSGVLATEDYTSAIHTRLHLLRVFYGVSTHMQIEKSLLLRLSKLPELSCEKDAMFHFYAQVISYTNGLYPAIDSDSAQTLFQSVLCDPGLDWRDSGVSLFDTFRTYINHLKRHYMHAHAPTYGPAMTVAAAAAKGQGQGPSVVAQSISTLWRIALSARDPQVP